MAFRPQIIKQYSMGNEITSINYIYQAAKIATMMLIIIAVPFVFETDYLLTLWLGTPPEYAAVFCRLLMVAACTNLSTCAFNIGIHATGRMKAMSFWTGICFIAIIPSLYICYKLDAPVEAAYYINIIAAVVTTAIRGVILHRYIPFFSYRNYTTSVLIPILLIAFILVAFTLPLIMTMDDGLLRCALVFALNVVLGLTAFLYIGLNNEQRLRVYSFIHSKISK